MRVRSNSHISLYNALHIGVGDVLRAKLHGAVLAHAARLKRSALGQQVGGYLAIGREVNAVEQHRVARQRDAAARTDIDAVGAAADELFTGRQTSAVKSERGAVLRGGCRPYRAILYGERGIALNFQRGITETLPCMPAQINGKGAA